MISARRALVEERPAVVELAEAARSHVADQRGGPSLIATGFDSSVGHDSATSVWCGLIGSVIVGYALVGVAERRAVITEFFVEPAARRVGVGDALLSAIIDDSRQLGCTDLDAAALPGDRATKNFFEAHRMTTRLLIVSRSLSS